MLMEMIQFDPLGRIRRQMNRTTTQADLRYRTPRRRRIQGVVLNEVSLDGLEETVVGEVLLAAAATPVTASTARKSVSSA